jgi:hypothetical protein
VVMTRFLCVILTSNIILQRVYCELLPHRQRGVARKCGDWQFGMGTALRSGVVLSWLEPYALWLLQDCSCSFGIARTVIAHTNGQQ